MVLLPAAKAVRVTSFNLWEVMPKIEQYLLNGDQGQEQGLYETYSDILTTVLEHFRSEDHSKVEALFKIV